MGATGAIITVKAMYELQRTGGKRALITMCIGGGQGIALANRADLGRIVAQKNPFAPV